MNKLNIHTNIVCFPYSVRFTKDTKIRKNELLRLLNLSIRLEGKICLADEVLFTEELKSLIEI
jgi:hypothetical protein